MSKKIIEAHDISKKYVIQHEGKRAYSTLVEAIADKTKQGIDRLRSPFKRKDRIIENNINSQEDFWALQDISFSINEGDRVGIIGRNGAGKSTLLKLLSRITEPTTGHIKIRGRVSSLLEVGTGFHPELTGRENIFLNGSILGMSRKEIIRKFDEIVAFAGIEKFLDTPVKRFSSGMYMRLGFAIAAHLDPDVLIVDEVLAVGDAQFQEKCIKKLNDLSSHGRTILFVSHDIGAILTLCNKGIFLENGRIHTESTIDTCVAAYMRNSYQHALQWKGDIGDEHVRFYHATLKSSMGLNDFFYQGDKVTVELDYEVLQSSSDIIIGVQVCNKKNQILACSHNFDLNNYEEFNALGRRCASLNLDSGLFHEGEYTIKIDCVVHNKKRVLHDEILLKFLVYSRQKNTRFTHAKSRDGTYLGNNWTLSYEEKDITVLR